MEDQNAPGWAHVFFFLPAQESKRGIRETGFACYIVFACLFWERINHLKKKPRTLNGQYDFRLRTIHPHGAKVTLFDFDEF